MTRKELIERYEIAKAIRLRKARTDLCAFTLHTMPTFAPVEFHREYYKILTDFADGKIKKAMIFVPPQHGKSEGSTRRLPAFLLGQNPNTRIAVISYNASKARKFNREIQRVIDTAEYREIFPDTILSAGKNTAVARTSDEFEIVGHGGSCKTVGVGGPLTGDPVDILIMDDIYKDAKTAWSPVVRESVRDWYDAVAETRLHNNSRQLVVFTRWHEDDLGGTLLSQQGEYSEANPDGWVVVKYAAIKQGAPTEWDSRNEGEALWPERHSLERLAAIRKRNPHVFQSLYQQDPQPAEGLMYEQGFKTYEVIPYTKHRVVKAYIDTADTGSDYLCAIVYVETDAYNYILDVYYTQSPMETTEPRTAELLTKYEVEVALIESNNGGRGFARKVDELLRVMGNNKTRVKWFTQSENKASRIYTHSADVQNVCMFPVGWERNMTQFYMTMMSYTKVGQNEHDDAPDALTGTVEFRPKTNKKSASKFF